ncbi:hypothetical protein HG535_0A04320 [Zygotorulaspora mrakii]|uniref:Ribosome-recycling factor, mitochondrial n=1 Tax=Zygotorulaspora mrakii TaxID=42260 RepID=A0A7H9AY36_ZYGMR|nr:uncharacterized protein HG535_0A04320 [Zygotorulaspora mrakii]QLG70492.1 hypothetical protein HG535_0A04320 [Zygotorulaspora mrakii]
MLVSPSFTRSYALRRCFTTTRSLFKKHSGSKKNGRQSQLEEDETAVVDITEYAKRAQTGFQNSLEVFKKKLNEAKQGVTNPRIFDSLKMPNGIIFTNVASTSLKGKNSLLVTVYDPKDTKNVVSTIMAAGLNLNPEKIPNNDQQLKISLPPPTTESRIKLCKTLKVVFEEYKNSSSKHSLDHVRGEILKELKSLLKKDDSVKKVIQDIEKTHKGYVEKFQNQLKQAEKSIMN